MSLCAVIMAGGVGSRFWPQSRERMPKQLLSIVGEGTMIQNTIARLAPVIEPADVFIITARSQSEALKRQVPMVPVEQIIDEPAGKNTAPCVALAALLALARDPDSIMIVLPADHLITDVRKFQEVITTATQVAEKTKGLVTIGMQPTRPETGYGYIQASDARNNIQEFDHKSVHRVERFAEKPDEETARRFLESGDFFWNSGMFVWRADAILKELRLYLPELMQNFDALTPTIGTPKFAAALEECYRHTRSISIDYGVMEKSDNVFVVRGDFGWNDVGSWDEVYRVNYQDDEGNVRRGDVVVKDVSNSLVFSSVGQAVAVIGVDDVIVVATPDGVLVCKRGRSQEVKAIVDHLRRKNKLEYL